MLRLFWNITAARLQAVAVPQCPSATIHLAGNPQSTRSASNHGACPSARTATPPHYCPTCPTAHTLSGAHFLKASASNHGACRAGAPLPHLPHRKTLQLHCVRCWRLGLLLLDFKSGLAELPRWKVRGTLNSKSVTAWTPTPLLLILARGK